MDEYDDIVAAASAPKLRKIVRGAEKLKGVQPDLINHWNNLQTEFDKAGLKPRIRSGFRTAKQQNDIFNGPRGKWTKGNDGYNKISPHQEGRALDLEFSVPQRAKGVQIIADYAKRNNLHVPGDEPWHIAMPKQAKGQSDDDYANVVEAAMGQATPQSDNYDDIVSAAISPRTSSRFAAPRQRPARMTRGQVAKAYADQSPTPIPDAPGSNLSRVFRRSGDLPVNPSRVEIRPRGFQFNAPSDAKLRADLRVDVANEVASSTPQGRAPRLVDRELDAEVESRLAAMKEQQRLNTEAAREGPSMGARQPGMVERIVEAVKPYTPGLTSIDTPMGPKTDVLRGVARGLTLGAVGDSREISSEELIARPDAEARRNFAEGVGETASAFVPYVAAGKAASAIPALQRAGRGVAAARVGATFGGVETAREGVRAVKTGESVNPTEIAVSTAIGAAMGGIPGINAGLKQRIFAAVAPQVVADVARGRTLEESAQGALTNLLFEAAAGRKLGLSAKRISELRQQIESRQTVPTETQRKLNAEVTVPGAIRMRPRAEQVNIPERAETVIAQYDQRGFTLIPTGNPRPALPRGARAEKTADGVVYYDPKRVDAATIRNTPTTELLGHVQEKDATTTEAVVARDPITKTEIQSSAVSPENVERQAAMTQANFPEARVEVGGEKLAQDVIAERVVPPAELAAIEPAENVAQGALRAQPTPPASELAAEAKSNVTPSVAERVQRGAGEQGALASPVPIKPTEPAFVKQARERKESRSSAKATGVEYRGSGGPDTQALIDDIIVKGWDLYAVSKPKFEDWAREVRKEFGEKVEPHLRRVYAQLSGVEQSTTSAKNASMAEDQAKFGLPERQRAAVRKDAELFEQAKQANFADPTSTRRIADKVLNDKHTLSDKETLQLDLRVQEIKNEHSALLKEIAEVKDAETIAAKSAEADALFREFGELKDAAETSGTEQGRAFRARQHTVNQDFDLLSMMGRAKKAKGRELTKEEKTRYEDIVKERDEAIAERDSALEKLHTKRLQGDLDRATRQRQRSVTKEVLDKEVVLIKQNIVAEFARLKSQMSGGTYSMGGLGSLDPNGVITKNLLKYARNRAQAEVGLKAEALIDEAHRLVSEFGVTRRQVAEALSGYGRVSVDKRSEAAKKLAEIRAEITSLLKAEDIETGKRTKGQQGPKRDLIRNANRLKQLQKQEAEWDRKLNDREFEPKAKAEPYPYNSDVRKAEDRVRIAEAKFNREMERESPGHQMRNISGVVKSWLLSGPPTQAMNIAGTASYQVFREAARLPASIMDAMIVKPFTGRRGITGPSPSAILDTLAHTVRAGGRDFMEVMRHGATKEQMERHQYQEIDFGVNTGKKVIDNGVKMIELAHNAVFRFMSASDRVFYQGAYRRNLIDRAKVQALNEGVSDVKARTKELVDNPTEQLAADAKHDALVSTFNNDNVLSSKIKRARSAVLNPYSLMAKKNALRLNAAENLAMDFLLPFDRTPTNVVSRIVEASPLGYVKNGAQLIAAAMRKSMPVEHQRQFSQTFGNATAGSALMALGWYLNNEAGVIKVDGYDVFLKIPGLPKINLRIVSPVGNILAVGARLKEAHKDKNSTWGDYVKPALREPLNIPILRAGSPITETFRDPERSGPKTAARFASMGIPFGGATRWIGKGIDPADKRYPDKSFKEQFQQHIPKWREELPASRVRLLGSEVNKATKEAERLGITIKGATKQEDETPEEFQKRQAIQNGNIRTQIETIMALPEYDQVSDEDKKKWIKQATESATRDTKESLPEKPEKKEEREFPMPRANGGFNGTYPATALEKYERMSEAARGKVKSVMAEKAWTLTHSSTLTDKEKADFKVRLDKLGVTPRSPNTPKLTAGQSYRQSLSP